MREESNLPGPATRTIGIVGPCAAGKTTLATSLKRIGIQARHIAQEHSYVPNMWQRITHPEILIFLDASYPLTLERRRLDWTYPEYAEQQHRLRHARQHADLYVNTDDLTPEEVLTTVLDFLNRVSTEPYIPH